MKRMEDVWEVQAKGTIDGEPASIPVRVPATSEQEARTRTIEYCGIEDLGAAINITALGGIGPVEVHYPDPA